MGSLSWDGQNIEDLPAEMLQISVSRFPRTVLEEVAGRLHGMDAIGSGNWAVVAEKLGYCDNSQLDRFARQAQVARTFPGLLLLQEWSRDPGSTAYVLLNVLREAGREDVLHMVVEALYNVHYMLLSVMVEDYVTREKRFLRVRTKKTSTLAASLENELPGLTCYTIVGPRTGISFQTIAEELQGKQLTLRKFADPQADSVEQIYGTPANACCTTASSPGNIQITVATTASSPTTTTTCCTHSSGATLVGGVFNIPPHQGAGQPAISVTIAKAPFSSRTQLDMNIPPGVQWLNNLSPPCESSIQENEAASCSPRLCQPNLGAASNDQAVFPAGEGEQGKKPKIDTPGHMPRSVRSPFISVFDVNFPDLSVISSDGNDVYLQQAPVPCQMQQPLYSLDLMVPKQVNRSPSLEVLTAVKQLHETGLDTIVTPQGQHNGHGLKPHPATMSSNLVGMSPGTQRKYAVKLNPDYIPHDPLVFHNRRPSCPLSASQGLTAAMLGAEQTFPKQNINWQMNASPFLNCKKSSEMQGKMELDAEGLAHDLVDGQKTDYVPHPFIEYQSKTMSRNASSPCFLETPSVSTGPNRIPRHSKEVEAMEYDTTENVSCNVSGAFTSGGGPTPCTYSTPFVGPEVNDWNHEYCHSCTDLSSSPLSALPSVCTSPESERMEFDDGYIGLRQSSAQPAALYVSTAAAANVPRSLPIRTVPWHAASSFPTSTPSLSCMQAFPLSGSIGSKSDVSVGQIVGSSKSPSIPSSRRHSRNSSAPELWTLLSSTQKVMSASLHDCLQARSRKPIAQDFPASILDQHHNTRECLSGPGSSSFSRQVSDASIQGCAGSLMPSLSCSSSYGSMAGTGDAWSQSQDARKTRCQPPQSHSEPLPVQEPQTESASAGDEMNDVPGWCPDVTDRTINEIMSKYMNDDGNFIVWYYAAKKMHVITVSHMGIRHYAVYKKMGSRDQTVFYIFEGGFESASLASLIRHYQRNGLTEPASTMLVHGVNDPKKKFKTPEESSVSRSSKSRLSHVKLKRPLVVRYGDPAVRK